jgi:hypothetical protein
MACQVFERPGAGAHVHEIRPGERHPILAVQLVRGDEAVWLGKRQGADEDALHHGKDRRCRPDPQRQRDQNDRSEAGPLAEEARGEPEIHEQTLHTTALSFESRGMPLTAPCTEVKKD